MNDGFSHLQRTCFAGRNTHRLQSTRNGRMRQNRGKLFAQTKDNVRHRKAMRTFMFEETASISVSAIIMREHAFSPRGYLNRLYPLDAITGLHSVRAYVLHGTRTDFSRNERKVFQTIIRVFDAISDKIIPRFAGTDAQEELFARLGEDFLAHYLTVQHNTVVILHKEQIATGTDVQPRRLSECRDDLFELRHRSILLKSCARSINAKSVVVKKRVGHSRISLCRVIGSISSNCKRNYCQASIKVALERQQAGFTP